MSEEKLLKLAQSERWSERAINSLATTSINQIAHSKAKMEAVKQTLSIT